MKKFVATLAVCLCIACAGRAQNILTLVNGNVTLKDLQMEMPELAIRLIGNVKKLPSKSPKDVVTRYQVLDTRYLNLGKTLLNSLQLECISGKLKCITAYTPDIESSLVLAETLQDIFGIKQDDFTSHAEDFAWPGKDSFCSFVINKQTGEGKITLQANNYLKEKFRLEKLIK